MAVKPAHGLLQRGEVAAGDVAHRGEHHEELRGLRGAGVRAADRLDEGKQLALQRVVRAVIHEDQAVQRHAVLGEHAGELRNGAAGLGAVHGFAGLQQFAEDADVRTHAGM